MMSYEKLFNNGFEVDTSPINQGTHVPPHFSRVQTIGASFSVWRSNQLYIVYSAYYACSSSIFNQFRLSLIELNTYNLITKINLL